MAKLKHLTEYHKKALGLKYKGVLYQDIAETLNEYAQSSGRCVIMHRLRPLCSELP